MRKEITKQIQVLITMTTKGYHPKDQWFWYRKERKQFDTLQDAKDWLKETYGKCSRRPIFIDTDSGTKKVGWVYGFRNSEYGHDGKTYRYIQQDWVSFEEVRPITPQEMQS